MNLFKCKKIFSTLIFILYCFSINHVLADQAIQELEAKYKKSVFVVETYVNHPNYMWEGTAFVVKAIDNGNGTHTYHFLSNAHVVDNTDIQEISWQLKSYNNALSLDATVLGVDHDTDVAVLTATIENKAIQEAVGSSVLPVIPWGDMKSVHVQDKVISIGNTKGRGIVTHTGHVNSIDKGKFNYPFVVIQTDAATNKGNSGSPIMNEKGELIGLHFYGNRSTGVLIGYEIPVDRAKKSYHNILNHKQAKAAHYGHWGLFVRPMDITLQQYYFKDKPLNGVQITNVFNGSPAARADVLPGDILIVDHKIYNDENLYLVNTKIKDSLAGENISIKIFRNGKIIPIQFKAVERPSGTVPAYHTTHNFTVLQPSASFLELHHVKQAGVFVKFDNPKQSSMFANFKQYALITKVNGIKTPDIKQFKQEWEKALADSNSIIVLTAYYTSIQYAPQSGGIGYVEDVFIRK